jgi:arylsulfatase A-like enzyme
MTSRFGTGALVALVALAAGCGGGEARDGRPRNAILISIDTLRPDHLGSYGYARETSPTLDRIAAEGVRFEDVTAPSPWTLPSHASMLTGLYPSHHGVKTHETRLSQDVVTLAEEFRDAGYATFGVVSRHNLGAPQFQLSQGITDEHFSYIVETEEDVASMEQRTLSRGEQAVATAKELLRSREDDEPFFLFLHLYDVHTHVGEDEQLSDDDVRWLGEMYDAEIRQVDDHLGRFIGWLADEGLLDESLLVATSGCGEEVPEQGIPQGRTPEGGRVLLLMRGPSVPAGKIVPTPVHGVDVTPTILGVMGVASRVARDGIDLSPAWSGGALPERIFGVEDDK